MRYSMLVAVILTFSSLSFADSDLDLKVGDIPEGSLVTVTKPLVLKLSYSPNPPYKHWDKDDVNGPRVYNWSRTYIQDGMVFDDHDKPIQEVDKKRPFCFFSYSSSLVARLAKDSKIKKTVGIDGRIELELPLPKNGKALVGEAKSNDEFVGGAASGTIRFKGGSLDFSTMTCVASEVVADDLGYELPNTTEPTLDHLNKAFSGGVRIDLNKGTPATTSALSSSVVDTALASLGNKSRNNENPVTSNASGKEVSVQSGPALKREASVSAKAAI